MKKSLLPAACLFIIFIVSTALGQTPAPGSVPKLRLGNTVKPVHYSLELSVTPTDDTFSGVVDIEMDLREATSLIWLNASELTIKEAEISTGTLTIPAKLVLGNEDFLGFSLDSSIGPGPAKLHILYKGKINSVDTYGVFKQKEGIDWYAFSQFESIYARRAFPCFDEPSFKVPWQLTLHVKQEYVALSNTPIISETNEPNGMKVVKFSETKPLPSYLVAFAVGPFEIVDAGKVGKKATQVRIITPRGKTTYAEYAAKTTPQILTLLENYFGIPYPYEKLD